MTTNFQFASKAARIDGMRDEYLKGMREYIEEAFKYKNKYVIEYPTDEEEYQEFLEDPFYIEFSTMVYTKQGDKEFYIHSIEKQEDCLLLSGVFPGNYPNIEEVKMYYPLYIRECEDIYEFIKYTIDCTE